MDEDQLSLAIGKRGQNARLTARLTGWDINIEKDQSAAEAFGNQIAQAVDVFVSTLEITRDQANTLVKEGYNSLEILLTKEADSLATLLGNTPGEAADILEKAQAAVDAKGAPAAPTN